MPRLHRACALRAISPLRLQKLPGQDTDATASKEVAIPTHPEWPLAARQLVFCKPLHYEKPVRKPR